jgi:hypothetical protein
MEPENIGIGGIIRKVHAAPTEYAEIIARRVLRLIIKQLVVNEKEWRALSPIELKSVASRIPSDEEIGKMYPLVVELIKEHQRSVGGNVSEDSGKDILEKKPIHPLLRALVSQACMQLLANQLHKHGELAQYIHDKPDLSIRILHQPERLIIFEHAIIPTNRIFHNLGDENTQLWTGHETENKHISSKWARNDNIIVLLERDPETKNFTINPILQGENIKIFEDQVLVFQDGMVSLYSKPDENNPNEFPLLWEFQCDIDTVEKVASFTTKTWWSMHRITGKKKNQDNVVEEKKVTLCFNREHPKLSYTTGSRRHIINGNAFTIDSTTGQITILASWKIQKIACRQSSGIVRLPNGEQYFEFTQRWLSMRLGFSDGSPVVSVERDSWWHIYENAVRDIIPHKNTFDIDKEKKS